jgi:hypothetical protein
MPGFAFAGDDYFLCMYSRRHNQAAKYCAEKSFQHEVA